MEDPSISSTETSVYAVTVVTYLYQWHSRCVYLHSTRSCGNDLGWLPFSNAALKLIVCLCAHFPLTQVLTTINLI
jgi:hypothetical protein